MEAKLINLYEAGLALSIFVLGAALLFVGFLSFSLGTGIVITIIGAILLFHGFGINFKGRWQSGLLYIVGGLVVCTLPLQHKFHKVSSFSDAFNTGANISTIVFPIVAAVWALIFLARQENEIPQENSARLEHHRQQACKVNAWVPKELMNKKAAYLHNTGDYALYDISVYYSYSDTHGRAIAKTYSQAILFPSSEPQRITLEGSPRVGLNVDKKYVVGGDSNMLLLQINFVDVNNNKWAVKIDGSIHHLS